MELDAATMRAVEPCGCAISIGDPIVYFSASGDAWTPITVFTLDRAKTEATKAGKCEAAAGCAQELSMEWYTLCPACGNKVLSDNQPKSKPPKSARKVE